MLWNLRTLDERKTLAAIHREISMSSPLRALIGEEARRADHGMVRKLRGCIDPFEYDVSAWIPTLKAAHAWLEAQAEAPGHRGVGVRSRMLLLRACQLAEIGMSRQEVAQALERTPTAIGQWLIRYTDPSHPLNDLAKRLDAALAAPRPDKRLRADRAALWALGLVPKSDRRR